MELIGREQEINEIIAAVRRYNALGNERTFYNVYGRGGIGKTALVKAIYEHKELENIEKVYVNASDCESFDELLVRIRFEFSNCGNAFEQFDSLYILFYNIDYYMKLSQRKKILDRDIENILSGMTSTMLSIVQQSIGNLLPNNMPLLGVIQFKRLVDLFEEKRKIDEIKKLRELYDNCSTLDEYHLHLELVRVFTEGVQQAVNQRKIIIIVDNYQLGTELHNDRFILGGEGALGRINAFWLFSSRIGLELAYEDAYDEVIHIELAGLDKRYVEKIIESCTDFNKLKEDNQNELKRVICENVIRNDKALPLYIILIVKMLERKIREEYIKNPNNEGGYTVETGLFGYKNNEVNQKNQERIWDELAYYFELGRTTMEQDCFHALSCKPVWDGYFMEILRREIPIYLLDTKNILEKDTVIETITQDNIKLHEEVKESLYFSQKNRIKYDVIEVFFYYFLKEQNIEPILDVEKLEGYFYFAKMFCNEISDRHFVHLKTKKIIEYRKFYDAFMKSVQEMRKRYDVTINGYRFAVLYGEIIKNFELLIEEEKTNSSDDEKNYEAYIEAIYMYGLFLYDSGRIEEAAANDKKYLELQENKLINKPNDLAVIYGVANAENAYGYDLSALQEYKNAYEYGKKSIDLIMQKVNELGNDAWKEFYLHYQKLDSENNVESIKNIKKSIDVLKSSNKVDKDLLLQLLKARGNIPWYRINMIQSADEIAEIVRYGKNTWTLRSYAYGDESDFTLKSESNLYSYYAKITEIALDKKIVLSKKEIEKYASDSINGIDELLAKYIKKMVYNPKIKSENGYLTIVENELPNILINTNLFMPNIYELEKPNNSKDSIREFAFLNGNVNSLEAGQYLGFAYYCMARIYSNKNKDFALKKINQAIKIGEQVYVCRFKMLEKNHKKTIESLYYTAKYLWEKSKIDENEKNESLRRAKLRAEVALEMLSKIRPSQILYDEYRELYDKICESIEKQ